MADINVVKGILLVKKDNELKMLLLEKSAGSKHDAGKLDFPGGKAENEISDDTDITSQIVNELIREVKEETGLQIENQQTFGFFPLYFNGEENKDSRSRLVFLCLILIDSPKEITLNDEHDEPPRWLTIKEFEEFPPEYLSSLAQMIQKDVVAYIKRIAGL